MIGIFLTLNFLPIQDSKTLSLEEKLNMQREFSINYDLGNFLIDLSKGCFIILVVYLMYLFYVFFKLTYFTDDGVTK